MVGDITPPSSNANTPLRAPISPSPERVAASSMDVDTGGASTDASPSALEGTTSSSAPRARALTLTTRRRRCVAEAGSEIQRRRQQTPRSHPPQDAPKDNKKPGGGAGKPANPRTAFRPKEKELYEADIVDRWNKCTSEGRRREEDVAHTRSLRRPVPAQVGRAHAVVLGASLCAIWRSRPGRLSSLTSV
jgi:hypothetical protein